jgi:hypothetical protein
VSRRRRGFVVVSAAEPRRVVESRRPTFTFQLGPPSCPHKSIRVLVDSFEAHIGYYELKEKLS